jgi:formylglycine-generating enzyme required for sulfatase activity
LALPPGIADSGEGRDLFTRQLACLHILNEFFPKRLRQILPSLSQHPNPKVRDWVLERSKLEFEDVISWPRGGYQLVRIPGGTFEMGTIGSASSAQKHHASNTPVHVVAVKDFYIGRYPVTNAEYGLLLANSNSATKPTFWEDPMFNHPKQPVVGVSWHDATRYARWTGLRLPTEAEWEYACRAGTTTYYYNGDNESDLARAGWYMKNSGQRTHQVGEKEPNNFGLYDMCGNVSEWVEDDWHDSCQGSPCNGSAWVDDPRGLARVIRGGAWSSSEVFCRSIARGEEIEERKESFVGIRLAHDGFLP